MTTKDNTLPAAPGHLSAESRKWWLTIVGEYILESHHLRILQTCCEAWDRMQEARRTLAKEGNFFSDRFGAPRVHPAVAVERDSRLAFLRATRELGLDVSDPDHAQPPPPRSGRQGR